MNQLTVFVEWRSKPQELAYILVMHLSYQEETQSIMHIIVIAAFTLL